MIAFGPVPSRRLGRSLGVNTIPGKSCTYSCRYCQVGRTPRTEIEPRAFYPPRQVVEEVAARLARLAARREEVHVLTIVPDGEPTLDVHLGETIRALRRFGLPIAVITNGSLLSRPDVRARLRLADWVSVKVDAATRDVWRRINRPDAALRLRVDPGGTADLRRHLRGRARHRDDARGRRQRPRSRGGDARRGGSPG